ncbi:hypothetical protein [Christiangramia sp. SM2212]|uniref:Uncharacterized protein n=1 Tax=Christiangramia sediminicola TaxID=3073267 RepID=A0ABU1EU28_9FLAO|nr:hypothetical protein [Christiangramia sp. SM2212]MDR5591899.1 hypothetical protein [Christiangramia sp. SM2212]
MDELLLDQIPIAEGNWILKNDGVYHLHNKYWYIPSGRINLKEGDGPDAPWMWPMHFGRKSVTSLVDIENLMTCFAILRNRLGHCQSPETDKITWEKVIREKGDNDLDFLYFNCGT